MTYTWANPEHIGVIRVVEGRVVYLDGGPEYEAAVAAGPAEYSGPLDIVDPSAPPAPVPASITFAQLLIGLVAEQWISQEEGEAWLIGTLPTAVLAVISTLPTEQQFAAKARALRPSEVLRSDPLVVALGAAAGRTQEELDNFFRTYSGV